jgi:hypothetical protein
LFEENEPTSHNMTLDYNGNPHTDLNDGFVIQHMLSSRPLPPMRRARAGTMPSFANFSQQQQPSLSPFHRALDRVSNGDHPSPPPPPPSNTTGNRHRSGSLNLSTSSLHSYYMGGGNGYNDTPWSSNSSVAPSRQTTTQPPSPSTEQLLQGDSDFSIARTLRSIGLEDDDNNNSNNNNDHGEEEEMLLIQQQRQQLHNLLSSASSTTNRSRSYSVNATALYQDTPSPPLLPSNDTRMDYSTTGAMATSTYASPLEEFATREQNRPRSSSMGLMESGGGLSWNLRRSPLGMMDDSDDSSLYQQQHNGHYAPLLGRNGGVNDYTISLGDTELLTTMMHHPPYTAAATINNTNDYTHDGYNSVEWANEVCI